MPAPRLMLASLLAVLPAVPPVAAQDLANGQRVFGQCRACHTLDAGGRNGIGPNLHGFFGRRAGAVDGFRYSPAMRQKGEEGLVWDAETARAYFTSPRSVVPGTSMVFVGIRNEEQVTDLLAYLKQETGAN